MELGEKLKLARQEAGLSQRQLCGDVITRNMLSQIEHGTARPSMDTLRYLASRLGKSVSWFLEENVVVSRNQERMEQARKAFLAGDHETVWALLEDYETPDPVFEGERNYLRFSAALAQAEGALNRGQGLLARELLEKAGTIDMEIPGLERQRLLLMGRVPGAELSEVVSRLPDLDEELLLRAEGALRQGDAERAEHLLEAAEDREVPRWNLLRGEVWMVQKDYARASECLLKAEGAWPKECCPLLEDCFREMGDFQRAYLYACKQR